MEFISGGCVRLFQVMESVEKQGHAAVRPWHELKPCRSRVVLETVR